MSLLSRHLASLAQASNFLWLFLGLPSMWEGGVVNEPHLGGSWVPEGPFRRAFEGAIHILPGGLPLWPAPLFPISSGDSIKMLKVRSKLMSYSGLCWNVSVWRMLLQKKSVLEADITEVTSKIALISLPLLESILGW